MNDDAVAAINHFSVLMEQQNSKLDGVLEAVGDMQRKVAKLDGIERDVAELKQDVKTVTAAVTATNRDVAVIKREVQASELKLHDIFRDLDEHVHLPAHGKEMLKQ